MADSMRDRRFTLRPAPELFLAAFVVLAGGCAAVISVRSIKLGLVALAALIILMLVSRRPVVLAIVAVAAVFAVQRLGGSSVVPGSTGGLSYSDALVAAASIMALPALAGTPELRRLRTAGRGAAVYLAFLLPSVIANPSTRAYLEWTHRLVLVGGSLLVGAWLVREHCVRPALRLLTLVACLISALAIEYTFTHSFAPASPLGFNKNFIGALLGGIIVVVFVGARELDLPPRLRVLAALLVGGGLLASQSRGADLAAVLGLLVAFVLDLRAHSRQSVALAGLVAIGLAIFAFISVRDQLGQSQADLNNSSAGVRFNVERVTRDIWRTSPVVGVGLKYFSTGNYGPFAQAPDNDVDSELAESGLIGLAGFIALQATAIAVGVRRRGDPLMAAAVGIVAGLLLHGMVDIYWTAGVVALPFLILGIALAGEPRGPSGESVSGRRSLAAARRAG